MGLLNAIWKYEELESVGPTFSGFLNKLGDSIRNALNPTPFLVLDTLNSGWTVEACRYAKVGNRVTLNLTVKKSTAFGFNDQIGTLPAGWRPPTPLSVPAVQDLPTAFLFGSFYITAAGAIHVGTTNAGANTRLSGYVTFWTV